MIGRGGHAGVAILALSVAACGSGASPTSPTPAPAPQPQITIQVSPNPLPATQKSVTANSATFTISVNITYRETAGASATITLVSGTVVRQPGGSTSTGSLPTSLAVPALGSATDTYTQDFDVTADVDSVVWRLSVTGTDAHGRTFTVTAADVPVNPPIVQVPPVPSPSRYELWGGPGYTVYLGCFSCNQFVSDSVFNQFGRYGSRFSPTSVANHFSDYGSQLSRNSACNALATNPPILLNVATQRYTELTLNRFRPFAETDLTILAVLRTVLCEVR